MFAFACECAYVHRFDCPCNTVCKWTVVLLRLYDIQYNCSSITAAGLSTMACVMHFMLALTSALCVDACSFMHICLIAQAASQSVKQSRPADLKARGDYRKF